MPVEILLHARVKMEKYDIPEELVYKAIDEPTNIITGHSDRKIYQLKLNGKILRLVVEIAQEIKRIITVYKIRNKNYEI